MLTARSHHLHCGKRNSKWRAHPPPPHFLASGAHIRPSNHRSRFSYLLDNAANLRACAGLDAVVTSWRSLHGGANHRFDHFFFDQLESTPPIPIKVATPPKLGVAIIAFAVTSPCPMSWDEYKAIERGFWTKGRLLSKKTARGMSDGVWRNFGCL